ncbi:MAG: hypothetical protein GF408_00475 [Candidatus Omnitrophica bacterium]|nr:hypothetical protein [Candidatus Omnitrophota bacterium]
MITDDKRAFKRTRKKFTVRYSLSEKGVPEHEAVSKNISRGGVYFETFQQFTAGDVIVCSVTPAGSRSRDSVWQARVVRCEPLSGHMIKTFGTAVEFIRPFGDSEKALQSFLPA